MDRAAPPIRTTLGDRFLSLVICAMSEIWIPESLRGDVGRANHWDAYHIDLKLKDGRVFKNLVAREGVCITGRGGDADATGDLPFESDDIAVVRGHLPLIPFWCTQLFRRIGRKK